MNLDNVRVLTHSAIRLQSDDGTVIYCDPYDLIESPYDADVVLVTHNHYDDLSFDRFTKRLLTKILFLSFLKRWHQM